MKRPAFQFYPADWRKDAALQSCSLAAQGMWISMICVMHECEPYGYLVVNGNSMTPAQLGRLVGLGERECGKVMAELEAAGVFSRDQSGVIFCRRMVKDERIRNIRAEAGSKGGNPNLVGSKVNQNSSKTENLVNLVSKQSDKQSPTPSSSSSSSIQKPSADKPRFLPLPADFGISDRVATWAAEHGHCRLDLRLEKFIGYARANGKKYADWDQAFMNSIRDDWAKIGDDKPVQKQAQI